MLPLTVIRSLAAAASSSSATIKFAAEKKQKENLEAILANIPEFCHVFISVSKIDKRGRLYKMLAAEALPANVKR